MKTIQSRVILKNEIFITRSCSNLSRNGLPFMFRLDVIKNGVLRDSFQLDILEQGMLEILDCKKMLSRFKNDDNRIKDIEFISLRNNTPYGRMIWTITSKKDKKNGFRRFIDVDAVDGTTLFYRSNDPDDQIKLEEVKMAPDN